MTIQPLDQPAIQPHVLQFRRLTSPLPDGRVRVTIECRLGVAGRLLGRIHQVGRRWQFRAVSGGPPSEIFATADDCKQAVIRLNN